MHVPHATNGVFRRIQIRLFVSLVMLLTTSATYAGELKVVELFTSQGCYSCPAADKLIAQLASKDADILNLEFHVDYWNKLQYRNAGNWVDPFSAPQFSQRQRQYSALNLRGENGVYTPQAVINGVFGQVGSNYRALKSELEKVNPQSVAVEITRIDATNLAVRAKSDTTTEADANIYLVSFLPKVSTTITSGENNGKTMENHNVVVDMRSIGSLAQAAGKQLRVSYSGGENRGCAVLVQRKQQGAIIGAARCP